MIEVGSIVVGSLAILMVAAFIGIVITTIVPYFIEGRSLKRQKQYDKNNNKCNLLEIIIIRYSLLSIVITITFIGSLANSGVSLQ